MSKKTALITGITGQDGSYLAELLLKKGYEVAGIVRKTSHETYANIGHIQDDLKLFQGDLLDPVSLREIIQKVEPDEVYNLASQSHPSESFKQPIHTAEITGIGAHRVLDATLDVNPKTKFYQASSSEMFGWVREIPQTETTPFNPANPYAAAKLYAYAVTKIYRESYKMFAANGILFNHESPRRHLGFITQKVTYAAACAKLGIKTSEYLNEEGEPIFKNRKVALGNLDAKRDWGFAGDYVEGMWKMLQAEKADDFVLATGETHTIKELCEESFGYVGLNWEDFVVVDKRFIRPTETGPLVGNPAKAKEILDWEPKTKFKDLVKMMVDANVARLKT
jgi:GDPmannose 4,6-dehydratase